MRLGLALLSGVLCSLGLGVPLSRAAEPSAEAIREELRRVYARPEFLQEPSRAMTGLYRLLGEFFAWLGSLYTGDPLLFWVLLLGCLALLILLLSHLTWTIWRVLGREGIGVSEANARAQRRQLSERFRAEAEACASRGEHTEAVRLLFLSLVHAFDERGVLLYRPALTNHEYLAVFGDRPGLVRDLAVFVELLDANWYGQQPTRPEDYADCLHRYTVLQARG